MVERDKPKTADHDQAVNAEMAADNAEMAAEIERLAGKLAATV